MKKFMQSGELEGTFVEKFASRQL